MLIWIMPIAGAGIIVPIVAFLILTQRMSTPAG